MWGALVSRRQAAVRRAVGAVWLVNAAGAPRDDRAYKKCGAQGAPESQVRKGEGGAKGVQASRAPRDNQRKVWKGQGGVEGTAASSINVQSGRTGHPPVLEGVHSHMGVLDGQGTPARLLCPSAHRLCPQLTACALNTSRARERPKTGI
eukprot:363732-Chlamydomonas_euryale.AAC.3